MTMNFGSAESGRLGGLIGGPRRAARLSPERRSEIASQAAAVRWGSHVGMDAKTARAHLAEVHAQLARNEDEHEVLVSLARGYEGWLRLNPQEGGR